MRALEEVRDPELDQSIVELGFVADAAVENGEVRVALRLPTYWCAANFSFLMVSDARRVLARLPGVKEVTVELVEHFAAEAINAGVAADRSFCESFPDEAEADLEELRHRFARKGLAARLHRLCDTLVAGGYTLEEIVSLRIGDLPATEEAAAYLRRRRELSLSVAPEAPLLIDEESAPLEPRRAKVTLAWGRTVAASLDGNAAYCLGLLATRYATVGAPDRGEGIPQRAARAGAVNVALNEQALNERGGTR